MTVLTCASTGKPITLLGEAIADSGEAKVWRTNQNGYLAKIYHSPTPERVQKLAVMIAHPPKEPNSHLNHISFAWPKSPLRNEQGNFVGFLMPEIKGAKELIDVYNPQRRKSLKLEVDWRFLHTTALNIASIIAVLHDSGYVLGDIKQQNILVNNRALPSIIDTDSFQVKNPKNGKIYRCLVGSEGYTPPELIGKDFSSIEQTEVHDRFRLAVIIYQLLFGESPLQGKWTGAGENPETNELIRRGLWLYSPHNLIQPVEKTIPLAIVHPEIQKCFLRCFNLGYQNPKLRPTAREWLEVLKVSNDRLTICGRIDSHHYSQTYGKCYWCDRSTKLGVDIFPGKASSKLQSLPKSSQQYLISRDKIYTNFTDITEVIWLRQKAVTTSQIIFNTIRIIFNYGKNKIFFWCLCIYLFILCSLLIWQSINNLFFVGASQELNGLSESNPEELTELELRKIANSEIKNYIIGIGIRWKRDKYSKIPVIVEVFEQTPAFLQGVRSGDQILEIDGISTLNMDNKELYNLLRGDINTPINMLLIRPGSGEFKVTLVRKQINNHSLDKSYFKRCFAHYKLSDYKNALNDCNEAVKINPNNDEAFFLRGAVHSKLGNNHQATQDLKQAARLGNKKARDILLRRNLN